MFTQFVTITCMQKIKKPIAAKSSSTKNSVHCPACVTQIITIIKCIIKLRNHIKLNSERNLKTHSRYPLTIYTLKALLNIVVLVSCILLYIPRYIQYFAFSICLLIALSFTRLKTSLKHDNVGSHARCCKEIPNVYSIA